METWDKIVEDHGPGIYRLARRILGSGADAEDVVQEAFLEVYRFQRKSKVHHWGGLLRRVVTHRAVDLLRKRRDIAPLDQAEPVASGATPVQAAVASELATRLRGAVAKLPQRQAEVFSLRYFDDRSYQQIAEILEMRPGAVGTALGKARENLKSILDIEIKGDK